MQLHYSQMGFKSRKSGSRLCSLIILPLQNCTSTKLYISTAPKLCGGLAVTYKKQSCHDRSKQFKHSHNQKTIQEWLGKSKDFHPYSLKGSRPLVPYLKGVKQLLLTIYYQDATQNTEYECRVPATLATGTYPKLANPKVIKMYDSFWYLST